MSGLVKLKLPAGGSKTLSAPDSASDETITLPAGTKTLATVENFTSTGIDDNATSTKLTTTSTGIDVTGSVTCDGLSVDGNGGSITIDTGAIASNPRLYFDHNNLTSGLYFIEADRGTQAMEFATSSKVRMGIASNGDISFYEDTGTTPKFFWDASAERLGIGTSSPQASLDVRDEINVSQSVYRKNGIRCNSSDNLEIFADDNSEGGDSSIRFSVDGSERMRIDSSGNIGLHGRGNLTGTPVGVTIQNYSTVGTIQQNTSGNTGIEYQTFRIDGTQGGSITRNGSGVAYNTSSDYRLKENVVPMTGSIDRLKQLKPSRFNFIADADTTVDGFLAHEAGEVVPECATGEKDAMTTEEYEVTPAVKDEEGNVVTEAVMGEREVPDYQGIDQSKLVPLLVASLQEAVDKIEALETRVTQLENNV